jgi:hypothetical protein
VGVREALETVWQDTLIAAACAALVSGIPSTVYAWWSGGDVTEATRAAGAMLVPPHSSFRQLFWAAALAHGTISLFWAAVLRMMLPRRHTVTWALLAAAAIAVLDLRVIGRFFPEIYALAFWPQFADHLAWGGTVGAVLAWRFRRRER